MTLVNMWCLGTPPKNLLSYVQYPVVDTKYKVHSDGTVFRNGRRAYFTVKKRKEGRWIAVPDSDSSIEIPIQVLEVNRWSFVNRFLGDRD
jgi:hypothetical protein